MEEEMQKKNFPLSKIISIFILTIISIAFIIYLGIGIFFGYMKYESEPRTKFRETITNSYGEKYNFVCTKTGYLYNLELVDFGIFLVDKDKSIGKSKNLPIDIIRLYKRSYDEFVDEVYLLVYKDSQKLIIKSKNPYNATGEYTYTDMIDFQDNYNEMYINKCSDCFYEIWNKKLHLLTDVGYTTEQFENFLIKIGVLEY